VSVKASKKPLQRVAQRISKGGLHRSLGVPMGKKIPAAKVEAATHSSNPRVRRQAALAETFAKYRPRKGKR
jgi:hypothetical protein